MFLIYIYISLNSRYYFSEELIALTVRRLIRFPLPTDYETRALTNAPPGTTCVIVKSAIFPA